MQYTFGLSICITTFNMEKYIERAIESVLMQKVNVNYEIIVADDCSTDNTIRILQHYQQKTGEHFKIIYAEKNRGLIENFAGALTASSGKYIASLDADDYWVDEYKLQKQVDVLNAHADIGFVHSNYLYVDEATGEKRIANDMAYEPPKENRFAERLLNFDIAISTTCFRRDILDFEELMLFVQKKFHAQDFPLFLSLTRRSNEYYFKEATAVYAVVHGSMSRESDMKKRIAVFEDVFRISNFFAERYPVSASVEIRRQFNHHQKVLFASWATYDFGLVKKYSKQLTARQFLKYNPKALYVFVASKNKLLYRLFRPWLLRKRKVGK